jgi:hypothetical protein
MNDRQIPSDTPSNLSSVTTPVRVSQSPVPWRFSLRVFFAFVAVSCLLFSQILTSYRLSEANRELWKLRREVGHLEILDPKKIHATRVESWESMTWKWRVCLPPNNSYRFCASREVPREGYPNIANLGFVISSSEPFTVTAAVRRDHLGKWILWFGTPQFNQALPLSEEDVTWLMNDPSNFGPGSIPYGRTQTYDSDKPLELVRLSEMTHITSKSSNEPPSPTSQGILIWFERTR